MTILEAIILGVIEGITEFLPISSTAHLTIAQKLLGYTINEPSITAFTAIIQIGAIAAAVVYFWPDIRRVATAWLAGLTNKEKRGEQDYKFGWAIIIGTIPAAVLGLLFSDTIEITLRSMWWLAGGLIVWSFVLLYADKRSKGERKESSATWKDMLIIGAVQCVAFIPGVSRSGATMSAGLLSGFDRVTATRFSFFLGIPVLVAGGIYQAVKHSDAISADGGVGWLPTIIAIIVSFGVAYMTIAWLLKFISNHNFSTFVWYRIALGSGIILLLVNGIITAV